MERLKKPWVSVPFFRKWALKNADIVTVHNTQLYNRLRKSYINVNFKILNSRLAKFDKVLDETGEDKPYFLVVSAFSADEPMEILLKGIKLFENRNPDKVAFKLTGNYKKRPLLYEEYYQEPHIQFLGFVSDDKYKNLFMNALGILSLSSRDDVQQFALMEAVGNLNHLFQIII